MRAPRSLAFACLALVVTGCSCEEEVPRIDATVPRFDAGSDADVPDDDAGDRDAGPEAMDGGEDVDGGGPITGCVDDEICGDGLDADCDGNVDEGCGCTPGDTAVCFRGDSSFRGVGQCADGMMVCEGSFEFGEWGPCTGDVLPAPEECDAAGVDEDCDGAPNDGCMCSDGDPDLECGRDTGSCEAGVQRCVDGMRTDCEGAVGPGPEACNGIDDDCDGSVDEALARGCGRDVGICRRGTEACVDGVWGECTGGVDSSPEACDGLDNDCDGAVDEALARGCGTDVGACAAGLEACELGAWGECVGLTEPAMETCNGADDDCDGMTDESLVRGCGTDVGICVAGTETCDAGAWGACMGSTGAGTEACEGSDDEDCDGAVDEGCTCLTGEMRGCGTDEGRCVAGTQTCDALGAWGPCTGATDPRTETCDGTDDDCDGTTDEGCACITGMTRSCGSDVGECVAGTETCDGSGRWGPCVGRTGPEAEVCNGRDDDCDTMTDEGDICPREPPTAMCPSMQTTDVGLAVTLNGGGSDPDGGSVSYAWTVVTPPVGSTATPTPASSATTSFTPDVAGTYTLRLCVTDDEMQTTCCTVSVEATEVCSPPTAPAISVCPTSWDRRPIVEFDPLPSGVTYELFFDGASYATVSTAGQNHFRPSSALATGGPPPGGSTHSIYVRACSVAEPTCCATSATASVDLIEACTMSVMPNASNIVFSEYIIDGDGMERGEAIELTNLSNCPVSLAGYHFEYCNGECAEGSYRWMDFGSADVIPPRGVYVAVRDAGSSTCSFPFLGPNDPSLFGLRVSSLAMMGPNLSSGWFRNSGRGGLLRIASGAWTGMPGGGDTIEVIDPYRTTAPACGSVGFGARGACGEVSSVSAPSTVLEPNELGRLWEPCDAVDSPVPACM